MKKTLSMSSAAVVDSMLSDSTAAEKNPDREEAINLKGILSSMTLDDKISQMIIPAIRTWDGKNVTELAALPDLKEALHKHQYGGIIFFGSNIEGSGQITALVQDLQVNNLENRGVSAHIPYFIAADVEGGIVVRLNDGTRMTGNMAIGATGEEALLNAQKTGRILGEEMAAAGFNLDFAPDIDVNNNAGNPVIGVRSFSDDPETVASLGKALAGGLSESGVIATYKHFPGHGDTAVDSHIGTPSVEKNYDQIKKVELVPFAAAIEDGAEMIMTAHITYPLIDEEVVFGDGKTKGFYPATMSKKIITDILRRDLGYDGVVVTDSLEMDAIRTAGLVPGEEDSIEYGINVAQKVIDAGIDILLIPCDMNCAEAVTFYDKYIDALITLVEDGSISQERIDESVARILKLKEKYGILDTKQYFISQEETIRQAQEIIGSDAHRESEFEIAKQAITLLKNEGETLPFTKGDKKIVFLGNQAGDAYTIHYALDQLKDQGIIDENTQVVNLALREQSGSEDGEVKITIDYYYDLKAKESKLHYTEELQEAIREADVVVGFTKNYDLSGLDEASEEYQGIAGAIADTHAVKGRFVLFSNNLPYDAVRFQDADAILLAYMGAGLDMDPTQRTEESRSMGPYNANVVAAIHMMFGDGTPTGTLPVQLPEIRTLDSGGVAYSDKILYDRGFGLISFGVQASIKSEEG
ncbi:MAG: glycoside hydrolase family 3 C-terminal domain-containing protein [Blautia sp.]|nr:glycoside hydrolase family 3 C-terminal domain-containing protein [Blautia sp.]